MAACDCGTPTETQKMLTRDNELAATYSDGRKLYVPLWDKDGEIILSALPLAAVSIDQDGKTFPEGSFWLRNENNRLKAGRRWAKAYQGSQDSQLSAKKSPKTHAKQGVKIQILRPSVEKHTYAP
jgi:hypothetical protein